MPQIYPDVRCAVRCTLVSFVDSHLENMDGTHVLKMGQRHDTGHGQERPRLSSSWSRAAGCLSRSRKAREVKPISTIPSKYAYLPRSFITNPWHQLPTAIPVICRHPFVIHIRTYLGTCRSAHEDMVSFSMGWAAIDECTDQTGKLSCW